jgi:hypothetical protein
MTEFIQKKKANFGRKRIVELLKEYFSKGYGSDRVPVPDNECRKSFLERRQPSSYLWSLNLDDYFYSSCDYSGN